VEDATFVVGVVKLRAKGADATASIKKDFSGYEHAKGWCDQINPKRRRV